MTNSVTLLSGGQLFLWLIDRGRNLISITRAEVEKLKTLLHNYRDASGIIGSIRESVARCIVHFEQAELTLYKTSGEQDMGPYVTNLHEWAEFNNKKTSLLNRLMSRLRKRQDYHNDAILNTKMVTECLDILAQHGRMLRAISILVKSYVSATHSDLRDELIGTLDKVTTTI